MNSKIKSWNKNNPQGTEVAFNTITLKKKHVGKTLGEAFTSNEYPEPSVYVEGIIGAVPIAQLELSNANN